MLSDDYGLSKSIYAKKKVKYSKKKREKESGRV